jgi:hypothetical protein
MPLIWVDDEQAELIDAGCTMLETALRARSKRVMGSKIITDGLTLQAHKLATVRAHLAAGKPRPWSMLPDAFQRKAVNAMRVLTEAVVEGGEDAAWEALRAIMLGPDVPRTSEPPHVDVPPVAPKRPRRKTSV